MSWRLTLDGAIACLSTRPAVGSLVAESDVLGDLIQHTKDLDNHRVLVFDLPKSEILEGDVFGDVTAGIDAHPLPVIVSIGGACTGRVLGLALLADIRIASRAATVNLPPIREALRDGLVASVTRVVGPSVAGYLVLTTATVRAEQAVMWGLFHEVVEPGRVAERAAEVARVVARGAPLALRYAKEAVLRGRDLPLRAALDLEADLYSLLQQTSDRGEGVAAYLEHRQPRFRGQ